MKARLSLIVSSVLLLVGALAYAAVFPDGYQLRYKFEKAQTLRYAFKAQSETIQEMMGSEQTSNTESDATLKLTSNGMTDDGNLSFNLVYEALTLHLSSAMVDTTFSNPEGLIGKRVQKTIAPNGDQLASVELDTIKLPFMVGQGISSQQEILQNLPTTPLQAGETVTATDVDSVSRFGGTVVLKTSTKYTLQGTEEKLGYSCLKIKYGTTLNMEGNGTIQGMKFFVEGDGDIDGTMYFAPEEGILVSTESQMDLESTAAITGQMNMTIPITQSIKSSLNLLAD